MPADNGALLALLERERAAFLAQVARVPVARQAQRPSPAQWSVVEIVEHVSRVDIGVGKLIALRSAQPLLVPPEERVAAQLSAERIGWIRNRAQRVVAPDRVLPTGALSIEAALAQLESARAALIAAFLEADDVVLDGAVHPHPFIGPVTLRGWVELAAHHDARHGEQVAEVADWAASTA